MQNNSFISILFITAVPGDAFTRSHDKILFIFLLGVAKSQKLWEKKKTPSLNDNFYLLIALYE